MRTCNILLAGERPGTVTLRSVCLSVCLSARRYEKQLQEEELSLQQQRRRLYKEVAEEKEMLAQLVARWVQRSSVLLHGSLLCQDGNKKKTNSSCVTADKMPEQLVIMPQCFFVVFKGAAGWLR